MKKLQKNMMIFFSLLFINQSSHASCITRLSGSSLVICGVLIKDSYDNFNYKEQDSLDVKKYPHSVEWYKNLAIKYPEAHLDQKKLILGNSWYADGDHNVIGADNKDLLTIESLISCQKDKLELDEIEKYFKKLGFEFKNQGKIQRDLAEIEAKVLHEAGHLELGHYFQRDLVLVGALINLELCYQAYIKRLPQAPVAKKLSQSVLNLTKSMPLKFGLFCMMNGAFQLIMAKHSQECEKQADAFACKHADLSALNGLENFFKRKISIAKHYNANPIMDQNYIEKIVKTHVSPLFSTHPSYESRLAAIQQEIARRELAQIK